MAPSLFKRMLGAGGSSDSRDAVFTLPGALHDGARVLLLDSGDLTDLLFVMPFIVRVRQEVPGAHLGLLCDERTSHLALSCEQFHDVIVAEPAELKPGSAPQKQLQKMLSSEPWDLAILVGRDPDPFRDELAYASGAILRLGPGHPRAYPRLNCEVRETADGRYPYGRTTTWGRLLGIELAHEQLRWPLPDKRLRQMAQLVHFNKPRKDQLLVGIDPGVAKEGTLLAAENLAFLVNHLTDHVRGKTLVLTSDPDPERVSTLSQKLRSEQLDLPRPTLLETVLLLANCDLFVSPNTDLLHFATAMGVPTLGIFTPQDGQRWVPDRAERLQLLRSQPGEELSLSEMMDKVELLLA